MSDSEKPGRVTVELKDFLRVTVAERSTFDTTEKAATELGMTVGSFKQRLTRERKRYPAIFESVPKYTGKNGPKPATQDEAQAILAELTGKQTADAGEGVDA